MNAMTRRHPVVLFVYYVMTLVLLIVAGHPLLYGLLLLLMGIDVSLNRGFLKSLNPLWEVLRWWHFVWL